jgi:hypothetical protein
MIRRATFDLTGLPPTPEEVDSFLNDTSAKAFEKVIDRLLASPHYGERWGRHWLDIVRFADTAGCNSDFPVPAAYKYRNYVIKSFNEDKPYDRFIREQIAGDLLPAKTESEKYENVIATGYLAMSRRFGSRTKEFNLTIDDTIDNLSKSFLGLSVSCARCHNHKFDPIPTKDYYALYGIFNSSRYAFPGAEIYPHPADMVALASGEAAEKFYKWQKELAALDDRKEYLTVERGGCANKAARKKLKEAAHQDRLSEQTADKDRTIKAIPASEANRRRDCTARRAAGRRLTETLCSSTALSLRGCRKTSWQRLIRLQRASPSWATTRRRPRRLMPWWRAFRPTLAYIVKVIRRTRARKSLAASSRSSADRGSPAISKVAGEII